jgi:hypothetical protein
VCCTFFDFSNFFGAAAALFFLRRLHDTRGLFTPSQAGDSGLRIFYNVAGFRYLRNLQRFCSGPFSSELRR